jgi:hypothetical protein
MQDYGFGCLNTALILKDIAPQSEDVLWKVHLARYFVSTYSYAWKQLEFGTRISN